MNAESNPLELNVLKNLFDKVLAINLLDNSISDSKIMRDAKSQLRVALLKAEHKCSCARRYYGPCEVCQASDGELVQLRNFYRVIRKAKKHNMTSAEIQSFVANTQKGLLSAERT